MLSKRKFPRVPTRYRCWCENGQVTIYAQMANIGEGGICILTHAPLDMGSQASLRFSLTDGNEIEATAKVVWQRANAEDGLLPAMGLRFEEIDERSLDGVRRYVRWVLEHEVTSP